MALQPEPAPHTRLTQPLYALREQEFLQIANLAHRAFGLNLGEDKRGLVEARLGRLVRELRLGSFEEYCHYLLSDRTGIALATLADRLTTNHTSFFREPAHFDFLRSTVFPALRAKPCIRIWSAGCSSGEEPYSIAISLLEAAPQLASRTSIHATDISTRMVERASAAVYSADRLQSIPPTLRERYLLPTPAAGLFRVAEGARRLVDISRLNLIAPFAPALYSVIFCRNVMFYFDRPTHASLVQRLTERLEPGGFLFIGHTETLSGIEHSLEPVSHAAFRKPAPALAYSLPTAPRKPRAALTLPYLPDEVPA